LGTLKVEETNHLKKLQYIFEKLAAMLGAGNSTLILATSEAEIRKIVV
jgi:hypothetical protein